jgi:hypothetical protein
VSWSETTILPLHNIKVSIKPSCVDPKIVASLSSVWVHVHGIPVEAWKDSFLELISQAIGKLEEVDGQSLAGQGPVRLRILCPDPSKLNCSISPFFFGKDGRSLVVELESEEDQGGSMAHSPRTDQAIPREPREDDEDDDDSSGGDDGGSDRDGGCATTTSGCGAPSSLCSALAHDGPRRCSGPGIFAWPPLPRVGGTFQECVG